MIEYVLNIEKRTVTATIKGCSEDVIRRFTRSGVMVTDPRCVKAARMKDEFSAVAKCHPDDEFDESIGKDVAKHKLLDKYHIARSKACRRLEAAIQGMEDELTKATSNENQRIIRMVTNKGKK